MYVQSYAAVPDYVPSIEEYIGQPLYPVNASYSTLLDLIQNNGLKGNFYKIKFQRVQLSVTDNIILIEFEFS